MKDLEVIAHRGFSAVAPENTMVAFRQAAEAGADGIELDVHLTKDGEVVVIHDYTVKRTTDGTGWVRELTLEELRRLDAGSWFGEAFRGEKIPTLDEVLRWVADRDLSINIELKNLKFPEPGLEEAVAERIVRYGRAERTIISSFHHASLQQMKEWLPQLDTAILYMANLVEPWVYTRGAKATSMHPYSPTVTAETVNGCRKAGLPLRPFTVNKVKEMRRLIRLGVDGIITDQVERLRDVLREEG